MRLKGDFTASDYEAYQSPRTRITYNWSHGSFVGLSHSLPLPGQQKENTSLSVGLFNLLPVEGDAVFLG